MTEESVAGFFKDLLYECLPRFRYRAVDDRDFWIEYVDDDVIQVTGASVTPRMFEVVLTVKSVQ